MLRRMYCWILRLHPRKFRNRFGQEMLSIFDDAEKDSTASRLVADGLISLTRQWTLSSEYQEDQTAEPVPWSSDGNPVFYTFDTYKPRRSSLLAGGMLTLVMFCVVWLVSEYTWTHPVFMPLISVESNPIDYEPPTAAPISPLPLEQRSSPRQQIIALRTREKQLAKSAVALPTPVPLGNLSASQPSSPVPIAKTTTAFPVSVTKHETKAEMPSSVPPFAKSAIAPILKDKLLSYAGVYMTDPPNELAIMVTAEDGQLAIEIPGEPKSRLIAIDGMKFRFSEEKNSWVKFVKRNHDSAYELTVSRNGHRFRAHRNSN
jgi:hypothetical protein